jgi:hypothetical protein
MLRQPARLVGHPQRLPACGVVGLEFGRALEVPLRRLVPLELVRRDAEVVVDAEVVRARLEGLLELLQRDAPFAPQRGERALQYGQLRLAGETVAQHADVALRIVQTVDVQAQAREFDQRFGVFGVQRRRAAQVRQRLVVLVQQAVDQPEAQVRGREVRLLLHDVAKERFRLAQFALRRQARRPFESLLEVFRQRRLRPTERNQ